MIPTLLSSTQQPGSRRITEFQQVATVFPELVHQRIPEFLTRNNDWWLRDKEQPSRYNQGQDFLEQFCCIRNFVDGLVDLAIKEKDHALFEMLQCFAKEQVEEEEHSCAMLAQIQCVGGYSLPPDLS